MTIAPPGPAARLVAVLVPALCACRAAMPWKGGELEGETALGLRDHPSGWEDSSVPLLHFDTSYRPETWPVGLGIAADLSGYAGDQSGEQTASVALGLVRMLALVDERLWGRLGLARAFLETDSGEIFDGDHDGWQATVLEGGLYLGLSRGADGSTRLGLELRYTFGDGPELDGRELEGRFLDAFLVLAFGP